MFEYRILKGCIHLNIIYVMIKKTILFVFIEIFIIDGTFKMCKSTNVKIVILRFFK